MRGCRLPTMFDSAQTHHLSALYVVTLSGHSQTNPNIPVRFGSICDQRSTVASRPKAEVRRVRPKWLPPLPLNHHLRCRIRYVRQRTDAPYAGVPISDPWAQTRCAFFEGGAYGRSPAEIIVDNHVHVWSIRPADRGASGRANDLSQQAD